MESWSFSDHAVCLEPDGRAVALYEIAEFEPPALVEIELLDRMGTVIAGMAILLDADFTRLKTLRFEDFVQRGTACTSTLFLNAAESQARYLLIAPDEQTLGGRSTHLAAGTHTKVVGTPHAFRRIQSWNRKPDRVTAGR